MEAIDKSVMIIASHPDDAELAMGSTIAALVKANIKVALIDLTDGEPTPHGSPTIRKQESQAASKILGVEVRETLSIKNREIFDTVENRKLVAAAIRRHRPEVLFLPYWDDGHPDHVNACALGIAARFYSKMSNIDIPGEPFYPRKMLHYVFTHIRPKISPSFIFDASEHFEKKLTSIAAYKSQFIDNPKNTATLEMIRSEGAYWGAQIGTNYGEPFVCKEQICLRNAESLLSV